MTDSQVSRRALLAGVGSTVAAIGLNACGSRERPTQPGAPTTPAGEELRRKIASLLVVGFRGEQVKPSDWIMRAISEQGLGGVVLFDRDQLTGGTRNISSPEQVTTLIRTLSEASSGRLIVSIDQEGGKTSRLGPANGFPATQAPEEIGAVNSPALTRSWAEGIANTLASIGVNLNFAPVVDLAINPDNPAIAALGRSFSSDPDVVVSCATEEIKVHRAAGVRTSIKHFPGFGSATGNTDFEIVDVSDTWKRAELVPFQRLIDAEMADSVMVAHLLNRQLDPDRPVSLSRAVVHDLLRGELGWSGAVVSDDMQAAAISRMFGRDEAVAMAVEAGVDMLTFANQQAYDENVVDATVNFIVGMVTSGRISEGQIDESVARIDALRPPK